MKSCCCCCCVTAYVDVVLLAFMSICIICMYVCMLVNIKQGVLYLFWGQRPVVPKSAF